MMALVHDLAEAQGKFGISRIIDQNDILRIVSG